VKTITKPSLVTRCVQRQDGDWLVVTKDGRSGTSPVEIPEGARVTINDGKAEKAR
jgi:hypothetical protein